MSGLMQTVTVVAGVGAGLIGGVFFAFSAFVMLALRRLPAVQGTGAMQSINRLAVTASATWPAAAPPASSPPSSRTGLSASSTGPR